MKRNNFTGQRKMKQKSDPNKNENIEPLCMQLSTSTDVGVRIM